MDPEEDGTGQAGASDRSRLIDDETDRIVGRLRDLAHTQHRFQDLLDAVTAVGRDLDLPVVLRRVMTTGRSRSLPAMARSAYSARTANAWRSSSPSG